MPCGWRYLPRICWSHARSLTCDRGSVNRVAAARLCFAPIPDCVIEAPARAASIPLHQDSRCTAIAPIPAACCASSRHRRDRAPFRLVPPHPRPRRRAVHRPARPLRADPGGRRPDCPAFKDSRDAALRMGGARRRQGAQAPRGHRECRTADRLDRSLRRPRSRCSARRPNCRCRCSANRSIRRTSG